MSEYSNLCWKCIIYRTVILSNCNNLFCFHRRDLEQAGEVESLKLEGDIGGGLILQREICVPKDNPKIFRIESSIVARKVGAGSGGFSRLDLISLYFTNWTRDQRQFLCSNHTL